MYKIESLDHYGRGITKIDGKTTFVINAIEDEEIDIKIYENKKNYNEALVKKYNNLSKDRETNICPFYHLCGGCNIMHMKYEKQLNFKQNKINNIIKKYVSRDILINNIVKSDNNLFYRNKVVFHVNDNIGLYNEKSNKIIKIDKCIICDKKINDAIIYLNKLDLSKINNITLRTNSNDLMVIIDVKDINLNIDTIKNISSSIYFKYNNKYILKYGKEKLIQTIKNYKYIVSPDSFFQINLNVCEKMYDYIKECCGTNKKVLDLYCGTGSISIYVSKKNHVKGIEINENAIKNANENKKINNAYNIDFICSDSGIGTNNINLKPDVIIIDPPRSGLNKVTINNILKIKPCKIIYVSCDPMTLSRDLNILKEKYSIKQVTPFDMFPNTYHVETVCVLERR